MTRSPLSTTIHSIDSQPSFLMYIIYDLIEAYNEVLEESPVTTKAFTSATVYAIGDIIAQRSEGAERLDKMRIVRSLLAGFIGHGPLSHCWYNFCEDVFQNWLGWTAWFGFATFMFTPTGAMRCLHWKVIWGDIRRTTIPLVVSGLKLWPAAHIITYGYVSVENRLLWVDIVEILWVTILATQAAGKHKVRRKKKLVAEAAAQNREDTEEESGLLLVDHHHDEDMIMDMKEGVKIMPGVKTQ